MLFAIAVAAVLQANQPQPRIDTKGAEPVLVLPDAMASALRRLNGRFVVRRLRDYPIALFQKAIDPSARTITSREAPFAVIGDFNGDQVLDAVVDGDDENPAIAS